MKRLDAVSIESTDACNLFCAACMTPHGNNFISIKKFDVFTNKLRGHITKLGLHWRGEPCLHPELPQLAEMSQNKGFKTWTSTNTSIPNLSNPTYIRQLLDNLEWIEFCVDGFNHQTTSQYRVGANWDMIKRNLETISATGGDCKKVMRVLMFKHNDGKEGIYRKMAKNYGMDEVFFGAPLIGLRETITPEAADKWLPRNPKYRRYKTIKGKTIRNTGRCNPNPIISVHGSVHPCCLDWKLVHSLGNLEDEGWPSLITKYKKILPKLGRQKMCELCCIPNQRVNFREKII